MGAHICDAMIVCCIDFRFQKYIRQFTDKSLKGITFDLVGFAGGTKNLSIVKKQIDISVKLHHIKELILIHHEECGAYGKGSSFDRHKRDLLKAKRLINKSHPKLKIRLYYLTLKGKFEKIVS